MDRRFLAGVPLEPVQGPQEPEQRHVRRVELAVVMGRRLPPTVVPPTKQERIPQVFQQGHRSLPRDAQDAYRAVEIGITGKGAVGVVWEGPVRAAIAEVVPVTEERAPRARWCMN